MVRLRLILIIGVLAISLSGFGQIRANPKTAHNHSKTRSLPANDGHEAATRHRGFNFQVGSPWPKFHGDMQGTGLSPVGGSNGIFKWKFSTGTGTVGSAAIGSDGTIYQGSLDNNLYAINPDGTKKWATPTGSIITSTPCIGTDGTIYVGSYDDNLYAINYDGSVKWTFPTWGVIKGGPTIGPDGTIYFGDQNSYLYAVNPDGTQQWAFHADNQILGTPSISSNGYIYFGCNDHKIYCVDPAGNLIWRFTTGSTIASEPAIAADGTVYATSNDGNLYCIASWGEKQWSFALSPSYYINSSPAIGPDGTIYVGSELNNSLYAINSDGSQKWKFTTKGYVVSAPAVSADGTVYFGSEDAYIYAVNPDGTEAWKYLTDDMVVTSPAIGADGVVYTASGKGTLYAMGTEVNTTPVYTLTISPTSVVSGGSATGTVTLSSAAPSGGDVVKITSGDPSVVVPGFVFIASGGISGSFSITTTGVSSDTSVIVTASSGGVNSTAIIVVKALLTGISTTPKQLVGGNYPNAKVNLAYPAPVGGTLVTLDSSDPSVILPASVTVPAGATSLVFPVPTAGVDSSTQVVITATVNGADQSCILALLPAWPMTGSISPTSVVGGSATSVTGTVALNGRAGPSGTVVSLVTSDPFDVFVPATVTVPAGALKASYSVMAYGVSSPVPVVITATANGKSVQSTLTVNPATLTKVSLSQTSLVGGNSPTLTVFLNGAAPTGGLTISLSSNNSAVPVPSTLIVPAGVTSAAIGIATLGVDSSTTSTITATFGIVTKTCSLTTIQAWPMALTVNPTSVVGGAGAPVVGTLALNGSAGPSGIVVNLASSDSSSASVPTTITVPNGSNKAGFSVTASTVATDQAVTLTGTFAGKSASGILVVTAAGVSSVATTPVQLVGGNYPTGKVTLVYPAPAGGAVVNLSSSNAAATVPATVTVPAGSTTVNFTIPTSGVDSTTPVPITASYAGSTKSCVLTLLPAWPMTLTVNPTTIKGGSGSVTGTVNLNGRAGPSGTIVTLSSSDPSSASVPVTVTVPAGALKATFTVATFSVASTQLVTLTATVNGKAVNATLTVNP